MASDLIGLDIGRVHTGVARASAVARLAEPLSSVDTKNLGDELQAMMKSVDIEAIVIGLPRNLKGVDTEQTVWVRQFVGELKEQIRMTLYWQDEALTSRKAAGMQSAFKKFDEHSVAAAIILQDFLDTAESERVRC